MQIKTGSPVLLFLYQGKILQRKEPFMTFHLYQLTVWRHLSMLAHRGFRFWRTRRKSCTFLQRS